MVRFKILPLFIVHREHKGHPTKISPYDGTLECFRFGIVLCVQLDLNLQTLCIGRQLHRTVAVVSS